ncbi:MAG TPA: hypothetical protein VI072_22380 [Polyangiaceae bacterium]
MPKRVLFLADQFAESSRDGVGPYSATELMDAALIQASPWPIEAVRIAELRISQLSDFDVHLVGNLTQATPEQCAAISALGRSVLLEHDYRMCRWRGNFARSTSSYHRRLWRCNCRLRPWLRLLETARGAIFLTHRQLGIYRTSPFVRLPRHAVLGCSVMGPDFFDRVARFKSVGSRPGQGTCVLHSDRATADHEQAVAYCKGNGIEATVVRDQGRDEVAAAFEAAARVVLLPQWPEPSSRVALEARFLGCELVSNEALGVTGESWWHMPDDLAFEFVREAPRRFWTLVSSFLSGSSYATHPWTRPNRDPRVVSIVPPGNDDA